MRDPVSDNLRAGNLRGEARWERQVLEACLENTEITELYTSGHKWRGYGKYKGLVNASIAKDCILILHDYWDSVINQYTYKGIIANIFVGPWETQKTAIKLKAQQYKEKLIFSVGYEAFDKIYNVKSYLKDFIPNENIVVLPVPGASYITDTNNFHNKILLSSYRILLLSSIYQSPSIIWALSKLRQDKELELVIVTSWNEKEKRDLINNESVPITGNMIDYFWNREQVKEFQDIKSQVTILNSIEHHEMLTLYSKTKLLLPCDKYYGGPGVEAAMHGVPFVGNLKNGAFAFCKEYLIASNSDEHLALLEKLYTNEEFYTTIANGYRDYAKANYSYQAFNNTFNQIMKERNLI
jgi:hypothetical protein